MHSHTGRSLLKQDDPGFAPEIERAIQTFFQSFSDALEPLRRDLVTALEEGAIDPSSLSSIELEVERRVGNYTNDIQIVYREGTKNGAEAGRALAGRRYNLDIDFQIVPESVLRIFEEWSNRIVEEEVLETITDESIQFIRTAQEEGLSIPDIAEAVNEDLFNGRLQDHVAERNARTATISSSNAGGHSAYQDASGVVGEEWLATDDNRTRDSHEDADGQVTAIDTPFKVGGHECRFPADPTLPKEELINCRCTSVPIFRDQLSDSEFATIQSGGRIYRSAPTAVVA